MAKAVIPGSDLGVTMELRVISNPIGAAGPTRWLLSNLFYGCGYNFHRGGHRLGVDDLLIRGKLGQLLEESRRHLGALAAAFQRKHLAPGPDRSFASPGATATAEALERALRHLEALEAAVRAPVTPPGRGLPPHASRERGTVERLVALDGEVVLALVRLRDAIARIDDGVAAAAAFGGLLRASDFCALWSRREALLTGG